MRLENLISRLLNLVIDLVNTVLGKRHALTHIQQSFLTAETSDATNAAQSDGNNLVNVCQELLTSHPYSMTQVCTFDLALYVQGKYHTYAATIRENANAEAVADATAKLDKLTLEHSSALSQLQAIINHEMLLAISKLLPKANKGGLILPMLERNYSLHNQIDRAKERHLRKPYYASTAIMLLLKECTGVSTLMQSIARSAMLRHARPKGMHIYEWSLSFELLFRTLKLTGYEIKDSDDKELYKDIFAAQLTQEELNLLFPRDFKTVKEGVFNKAALEAFIILEREIFSPFIKDKRIDDFRTITTASHEQPLIFAPIPGSRNQKRESSGWEPDSKRQKRIYPHKTFVTNTIRPHQQCHHPLCLKDGTSSSHTDNVCLRQSSTTFQRKYSRNSKGAKGDGKGGKGDGKGKKTGKGKRGKDKGKADKSGKGRPGKGKALGKGKGGKGKSNTKGKRHGSPSDIGKRKRTQVRIAPKPYTPGVPFGGECYFCHKPGHVIAECKAKKEQDSNPTFLAKADTFEEHELETLVLICNAQGSTTCTDCYNPLCAGPTNCNIDDIVSNLSDTVAKFKNLGLDDLCLRFKAGASPGIQSQPAPQTYSQVLMAQEAKEALAADYVEGQEEQWETPTMIAAGRMGATRRNHGTTTTNGNKP